MADSLTLDEHRARYAELTTQERDERMMTEIGLGIAKSKSFAITCARDSAMWDKLAVDIAALKAQGLDIDYGYTDPF